MMTLTSFMCGLPTCGLLPVLLSIARVSKHVGLVQPGAQEANETHFARLQAPNDLLCPIMHSVMRNPVCTTVGNVYEEEAIRAHLKRSNKDPLSNQEISDDLRPVFVLRSKAKEYATTTALRCIERVLDPACQAPAKYLRRACDVTEEAGVCLLSQQGCAKRWSRA
jgi:hypothetical protein